MKFMDEKRPEIGRLKSLLFSEDPVTVEICDDMNITSLCRTCLSESADNDLTNEALCIISSSGRLIRVYEMFEAVTGLKIESNDGLPRFLCSSCLKHINSSYTFRTQSQRAEQILQNILHVVKDEQEVSFTVVNEQDEPFLREEEEEDEGEEIRAEQEEADALEFVDSSKNLKEIEEITLREESDEELLDDDLMEIEQLDEVSEQDEPIEVLNMEVSAADLTCPFCAKIFYLQRDIIQHYKDAHPKEKPFKCADCQATFAHIQSMRRHKKLSHTPGSKEKMCPQCSRLFHRADDLKRHIRTHTDERPYSCTVCEKAFKQHTELKDHMLRHMDSKMYKCTLCSKELRSRNGWYLHVKMHQEGAHRRRARKKKQAVCDVTDEVDTSMTCATLVAAT